LSIRSLVLISLFSCILILPLAAGTEIIVGINKQFPPYEFIGLDGVPQGCNVDIMKEIAHKGKFNVRFVADDWDIIRKQFDNGEIDILSGMIKTPQREQKYIFSLAHTYIHYAYFVRKDAVPITRWEDLSGKSILVEKSDVIDDMIQEQAIRVQRLPTTDYQDALIKLSNGLGDVVLMPSIQGFRYIAEHHLDNLMASGNMGLAMPMSIALHPSKTELRNDLNRCLIMMNTSYRLREIQNKWFGIYDRDKSTWMQLRNLFIQIMVVIILALIIAIVMYYYLSKKVRQQKRYLAMQIAERNSYESEFNRRHQLFVTGPIVFMKWNDVDREMFDSISDNFAALGYVPNDIMTGRISYRSIIHPDDLEWVLYNRQIHLEQFEYSYYQIYRVICPITDNRDDIQPTVNIWHERNAQLATVNMAQVRWIYDYTIVIPDEVTHTFHFYGYLLDITKQKMYEAEMAKQHQNAQVAIHTKDAFLARVSAEINSPLNALIGLVRKLTNNNLPEDQKQAFQTITGSALHLKQILTQIHDFLSILKGSMGSEKQWYILRRLLEPIITEYQIKVANKQLGFEYQEFQPAALVYLDCDWFQKIVRIVIDNAVKFTTEGKISLTIDLFRHDETHADLCVTVEDTGVGIPEDKLWSILEPFTQVDESFTRRFGGIGLGLSIARNLLIQMDGKIAIQSQPGNGTKVELRFPVESK
jgi:two-component system sensor histidine kinase EvgS